ncbi:hypothetical protein [Metabacillus sediminilitoris]|uniref:IDEAL domain-containing protein n=1 Tax=Metabacillus sediminilitoris TaxID=2567941 RepID=A0A4S4C2Z3_9BACI|nr:hypothetical protein [Metabacillus sediminilitoris]QGQ47649.1 hypothetical protein GMB29_21655 [Metabacillus sediminilitoris]THF82083.1 hypothetical protein E6W99_05400 [Metabacillus sediminilitoris]
MSKQFIVAKTFEHLIDCFCPEGDHAESIIIHKTDIIEVKEDRKFVMDNGWYSLVVINNQWFLYMAIEDLEHYFNRNYLYSMLDIELKINYLQFQVNQALDEGNEALFINSTSRLNDISDLLGILNEANQTI